MMNGAQVQSAPRFFAGSPGKLLAANNWDLQVLRPVLRDNGEIRANDLLRKDEWKLLDTAVVETAKRQLGAIEDFQAAGLAINNGGLGVMNHEYEAVSYVDEAEQNMSGVAPGQRDLADFALNTVPVPITFRDFQLHLRHLEASRRGGSAIDTTNARLCAQRVQEKLEEMLFNGSNVQVGGNTIAGLTTATSRITGSLTGNWATFPTVTGENIVADVLAMIADGENENYFGQYMFYVPVSYMQVLRNDFKANSDKTIMQRLEEIDAFQGVRGTTSLTTEVVAVRLVPEVVDLSVGAGITTVQWDEMGGMIQNFKVMAAMAPRVKIPNTANAKTGLVHYT